MLIRRLFCHHYYYLKRWHWTHGFQGNEPMHIEAEEVCEKCGKIRYFYPPRNSADEKYLIEKKPYLRR